MISIWEIIIFIIIIKSEKHSMDCWLAKIIKIIWFTYLSSKQKKDPRKRLTNYDICECKDMIKNNIEISFDIKIDRVSFPYIMEYENQDLGFIEHCNNFENQLSYYFILMKKINLLTKEEKK